MQKRLTANFTGRVQGVGFRATCARLARGAGLSGWVRNLPDRSVALELQGRASEIEEFLNDLRGTYAGAGIRNERLKWGAPVGERARFEIRG